jgi:uncharacterized integral membrane protein
MNKFKALFLAVIGAVLAIFTVQNWQYPNPPIHILGFQIMPFPQPVIIFGFFILGFLSGWLANAFGVKQRKHEAPSEKAQEG